jgi:hypothetical protein
MNKQVFNLVPINGRKSFNNKAKVIVENGKAELLSYDTIVAEIDLNTNEYRQNGNYSQTTNSHIKAFKEFYNVNCSSVS